MERARVVIGKYTRRSSYMFEYSLVSGLTASGADVFLMHITPTPSVSYITRTDEFDCANGAFSTVAKAVFDALGAKTYVIIREPDGTIINTNCCSTHIEALQEFVMANNLDVGFAYDGDGVLTSLKLMEAETEELREKYVNQMVEVIDSKGYIL